MPRHSVSVITLSWNYAATKAIKTRRTLHAVYCVVKPAVFYSGVAMVV